MNSKDYGKQKMAAWLSQLPGILLLLLLAFAFRIHHSTLKLGFIHLVWVISMFLFLCIYFPDKLKLSVATRLMPSQRERNC